MKKPPIGLICCSLLSSCFGVATSNKQPNYEDSFKIEKANWKHQHIEKHFSDSLTKLMQKPNPEPEPIHHYLYICKNICGGNATITCLNPNFKINDTVYCNLGDENAAIIKSKAFKLKN